MKKDPGLELAARHAVRRDGRRETPARFETRRHHPPTRDARGPDSRRAPMHPLVRDLFKRFLVVGRDYPLGLSHVRAKAKAAILANAGLTDELAIKRAVGRGRWMVRRTPPPSGGPSRERPVGDDKPRPSRSVGLSRLSLSQVNELIGVIQLRKYRTLRKRYASDPDETAEDALRRVEAAAAAAATARAVARAAGPAGNRR